ncbi:MAG: transposase, partial [Candidatus Symbiothrix sp.]|nr:transposase [Candidatus Symbiothrix sp.]
AETNGFVDITNVKQLASFSGLDVKIVESGTWKGKSKISKKGNSHIRKALFMPAFSKIKKDHATNEYCNRLKQAKGKGMIAAVAVQRKLPGLMFSLWKNEEMFKSTV